MPPRTTIGLIGVGRIGAMHAANLRELESAGVDLVLTDSVPERARNTARELGSRAAPSVEDLFAEEPNGIVIAVGTEQHAALLRRSAEAGIPAFCEKPVAESTEASLRVLETLEETEAVVQIGHQRRLDPGFLEAKRAFEAGELGWLHTIRAITCDMFPPPADFLAGSGGIFRDCSVHDFDTLQWLTGRSITDVFARGSNRGDPAIREVGDVDSGTVLVTFDDGSLATVSATRYNGAGHDVRLELHGSEDTLHVGLDGSYAGRSAELDVSFPLGRRHTTFHERFARAYKAEMQAFVEVIRGKRDNPCTPAEAVDASRVADAAQLSLDSGQPQPVLR